MTIDALAFAGALLTIPAIVAEFFQNPTVHAFGVICALFLIGVGAVGLTYNLIRGRYHDHA